MQPAAVVGLVDAVWQPPDHVPHWLVLVSVHLPVFQGLHEAFCWALSYGFPLWLIEPWMTSFFKQSRYCLAAYWLPRSEWWIRLEPDLRLLTAVFKTAKKTNSDRSRMQVMPATQSWSGQMGTKSHPNSGKISSA
jgi:hypothetical protein